MGNHRIIERFVCNYYYLHDAHNGPTKLREVLHTRNNIGCVKESNRVTGQQHEQTHHRQPRPLDKSNDSSPHKKIPKEALDCSRQVDQPWPTKVPRVIIIVCYGGV